MRCLLSILILLGISVSVCSQETVKSLKRKQRQAKQNIEMTNRLLNENKKNQKTTANSITVISRQIEERENLIKALNDEVGILDRDLSNINAEKSQLEEKLQELRKEYAKLLYHYYFHKTKSNAVFYILSSESLTQGFRRLRYVQQYSNYRKEQAQKIQQVTDELGQKETLLSRVKEEKHNTLKGKQVESNKLLKSKESKQKMLTELSQKESDLKVKLEKQQRQVEVLNKKIDDMIAAEIAKQEAQRKAKAKAEAERKAKAAASKKPATSGTAAKPSAPSSPSTPSAPVTKPSAPASEGKSLVSGGFESNRGRLPWPVRGIVTGHFGLHPHPVLDHVQVNNKGIYIQTTANSDASAVYDGEVTQVFAIPGNNNAIIVKHGIYRTVYANLTTTYVKVGDKVKARQKLGRVFVDQEADKTELYFMLYKESVLQNPELWLAR
ncbi:MAG: peptidoglycan DD-metalloendopeptidase family protein [Paludibacteraceae bacterium]|nr:peptidoglycan DD-metalloendopeptidase family protein [Paludibacteraceae bacterium]